jgi:4-hydroxy-2-oxoheptanedioate aldolase
MDASSRYSRVVPVWIKERLRGGDQLVGSFLQLRSSSVVEAMARGNGFDFLCVEGEHSSLGPSEIASLVRDVDLVGMPCLVRVGGNDFAVIASALDAGAAGIVVPRVESAAEADAAVFAAHFPPAGGRGAGPGRASRFGSDLDAYLEVARTETLVCVQVESRAAVEQIDELASTPLVDLIFVGPRDLALSYGLDPVGDASELRALAASVFARSRDAGKLTGIYCHTPEDAKSWLSEGVSVVIIGSDLVFLTIGSTQTLHSVRDGEPRS